MGEAVGHDDVLVEVVGARGTVILHLVDHLADGKDGGGVGLDFRGGRRQGFGAYLAGGAFICNQATEKRDYGMISMESKQTSDLQDSFCSWTRSRRNLGV